MRKYALIFPGQGSQYSGMGKDLYENSKEARYVFEVADKVLGRSISDLCFNGSEEELKKTINSQPCILAVSIAAYEAIKEKLEERVNFVCTAGHSLGEYAAMYASGVIDLETAFRLIDKRAQLMNEAAEKTDGGMAAVLGLKKEDVIAVANDIDGVFIANFNSPEQVVITGNREAINENADKFKQAGAKRVLPLAVSGAFHSPLMRSAGNEFEKFVEQETINSAKIPVYTNVDAKETVLRDDFIQKMPEQIYSSVQWVQTIENMMIKDIKNYIELGAGKVLAGLNKKINPELTTYNVYDMETLNNVATEIIEKERELV